MSQVCAKSGLPGAVVTLEGPGSLEIYPCLTPLPWRQI